MFKVLIADDEPYVRQGLKNIIPWSDYDFFVCEEGVDGDDTYEKIMRIKPDLVLIDIKMPGKSGLDVIRETIKQGFKGKFVIISGHSEFSYAKEAMRCGVKSYILKPIDEDELISIIKELQKELQEEVNIKNSNNIKMNIIKEHMLTQLCLSNIVKDEELISSIKAKTFVVALISNYNSNIYDENIIKLEGCIKQKLVINNINIFKVKNKVAVLFYDKTVERIYSILEKLKVQIEKELKEISFITIGHAVNNIREINSSYITAENLMKRRYVYLNKGIISENRVQQKYKNEFNEEDVLENLYTYVEIGEVKEISKALKQLEKLIIANEDDEQRIKVLMTTFYIKLKEKIVDNNLDSKLQDENKIIIEKIHNKGSLHEVIEFLNIKLCEISKNLANNTSEKGIKRIVKYVDNKYYSDLKLESLAEIFNYNSSYLGKIFKDNTGKNFNSYLDSLRIEQAKKLLKEDNLKVYEVCEKVGYKNIDYFYCKFKKHVGISPLKYKKNLEVK